MKTFITLEGRLIDLNGVQVLTPHFDPETSQGSHYVVKTREEEFRLGWKNGYTLEKKLRNRR